MVSGGGEAEALLRRLDERGVRLLLEGEALRVSAPKGVLNEALRAELTANKPALIALLQERASAILPRAPREGRLPVSAAQQRLWFLDQVDPGNPAYNIACALRLRGKLDQTAFKTAIEDFVARHDGMRTRIGERNGGPWVEVTDAARTCFEVIDLSHEPTVTREATAMRLANELGRIRFDMSRGPLSKLALFRLSDDHYILASCIHHIVFDGWSLSLMLNEIFQSYAAHIAGEGAPFAPLAYSPIDYAAWENEQVASGRFERSLAYWKQALKDAPALMDLPTDRPRPAAPTLGGARLVRFIDPMLIARVKARAQQQNATTFMALMACWQAVLHRYSGQQEIVVGTPLANRGRAEFEGLVGCLINNVVIRGRLQDNPTLAEFLDQISGQSLQAFEHGQAPFDLVVERINPARSVSHSPIFQILFTHISIPIGVPPTAGLRLEPIALETAASRFDLSCEMSIDPFGEHANQQRANYEFSLDLFDSATIERLHEHFEQMLSAFVEDASQKISDVPLTLSADDRVRLEAWSAASSERDRSLCPHQLFEAAAASTPNAPAVTIADETVSYGDLDRRANRLARLLQEKGVQPKDLVAFCLDRTSDIPAAMAATWKAGAAYVPLDPTHPQERLRYVIDDAHAACVVTLRRFASMFDVSKTRLVILDEVAETRLRSIQQTLPMSSTHPDPLVAPRGLRSSIEIWSPSLMRWRESRALRLATFFWRSPRRPSTFRGWRSGFL
jgi:hypothetical protein